MDRIQKVLAHAGVSSRRAIEAMILEGRVEVNGQLVTKLPCFVDAATDDVRVDGRKIRVAGGGQSKRYFLVNKPRGVVCTQRDPEGRPRAIDLLPPTRERLYCVGRLDVEDTGLILLTNDGEWAEHVLHPPYGVEREYAVGLARPLTREQAQALETGVELSEGIEIGRASCRERVFRSV